MVGVFAAPPFDATSQNHLLVLPECSRSTNSSEILTVLGGKASCRRKFVLNVHLVEEHGRVVNQELSIVASVAYAHDHSPVVQDDKPFLAEPPLFTTFNGVEFPAQDRPTRMVAGRACFKLALSLLSSKCDNRLFCICFTPEASADSNSVCLEPCYSKPIRSISRKRSQVQQAPKATTASNPIVLSDPSFNIVRSTYTEEGEVSRLMTSPTCSSDNGSADKVHRNLCQKLQRKSPISGLYSMALKNRVDVGLTDSDSAYDSNCKAKLSGGFSHPAESFQDTEPWSLDRGLTPEYVNLQKNTSDKDTSSPNLSLTESSSPSSGILTSDSCSIDHNASNFCTQPSLQTRGRPLSAPPVTRPFRPYASVGACKVPLSSGFPLGLSLPSACRRHGQGHNSSSNALMDKLLQLLTVSGPMAAGIKQKLGAVLQGFSSELCHKEKFKTTLAEFSLDEEEKCLEIVELSLQEAKRELEKSKEQLRIKRKRLVEDEARIHGIVFESSSWMESLNGRFSL